MRSAENTMSRIRSVEREVERSEGRLKVLADDTATDAPYVAVAVDLAHHLEVLGAPSEIIELAGRAALAAVVAGAGRLTTARAELAAQQGNLAGLRARLRAEQLEAI